jgi:hypothetical protein
MGLKRGTMQKGDIIKTDIYPKFGKIFRIVRTTPHFTDIISIDGQNAGTFETMPLIESVENYKPVVIKP